MDKQKAKAQLITELQSLRHRVAELEALENGQESPTEPLEGVFQSLFYDAPVGIFLRSPDGRYLLANPALAKMYGYSSEEELIATLNDTQHQLHVEVGRHTKLTSERREFEFASGLESQVRLKDGGILWISETTYVSRDEAGAVLHYGGFVEDITQRKRAEEALRESETRVRQIAEHIREVFWLIDSKTYQVLYVSPEYEEIWGRSCESLYKRPQSWLEAIHPEDRKRVTAALEKQASTGEFDEEFRIVRPDGSVRWVLDRGFPIRDKAGQVYRIVGIVQNISERKRAEQALQESEERFRDLYESAPIAYFSVGMDGCIRMANKSAKKMLRYSDSDLVGRSVIDLYANTPLGKEKARRLDERIRGGEEIHSEELEMCDSSGSSVWVDLTVLLIKDSQGRPVERRAMAADVTNRKQAESELQRLALAVSNIGEGVVVTDSEGRIEFANRGLERLLGYKRGELEGKPMSDLYPAGADSPVLREIIEGSLAGVWSGEAELQAKTGKRIPTLETASPISDAAGRLTGYVCTNTDITERKRAEEALRESETRVRQIVEHMREVFWLIDSKTFQVLYVSPEYEEMWGRSCKSLYERPQSWLEPIHPEDRKRVIAALEKQASTGEFDEEFRIVRPDGSVRWVLDRGFPIRDKAGQVYRIVGIAQNISERKRVDESLRRDTHTRLEAVLEELRRTQDQVIQQERLRAIGTMASGIAHDFNNTLVPILGFSDLLLSEPHTLDDRQKALDYLTGINTAARDGAMVVSRMRELYRHREDDDLLRDVDLNQVAMEVVSITRPKWKNMAQAKGIQIEIRTELAADLPLIRGNQSALRTAITNLVINSVDAIHKGGRITISTRFEGEQATIEVRDTGIGMSEEVRRRALEPFFTTRGDANSGLGLATVYGIVHRHAGKIVIGSKQGKWTTVAIRLPTQSSQRAPTDKPSGDKVVVSPLHILVVDDEPLVRQMLTECLSRDGHTIETASSGREALENFQADKINLVLIDRSMPEMSGDQVATAIKRFTPGIPIIMLTGFGEMIEDGDRPTAVDLVLPKPITPDTVRRALQNAMSGHITGGED